jgi:2,3-dihydroxybenzoate-AMP ligase
VILQLPNELEFVYCYFAAVKIGIIPILALPVHRDAEISFFAQFTKARAHVIPSQSKEFHTKRCPVKFGKRRQTLNLPSYQGKRWMMIFEKLLVCGTFPHHQVYA